MADAGKDDDEKVSPRSRDDEKVPPRSRDDEPVPKLPRTAAFKVSPAAIFRILFTAAMLVMVIVATKPCANSVSKLVNKFDGSDSAAQQMPKPGTVDEPSGSASTPAVGSAGDYEQLRPDMTEAELKAAIERAKAKARGSNAGSGSSTVGSGTN